jgi:GNAT superfamily N-acetyltransferase
MAGYRKLNPSDLPAFADHLLRLTTNDRCCRFGSPTSDDAITRYCEKINWTHTVIVGFFEDGALHAAAELRLEPTFTPSNGELAFSVERPCQGRGIGTTLMRRILVVARNLGLAQVAVYCLAENMRMRKLLVRVNAPPVVDLPEALSVIDLPPPDTQSLLQEQNDDQSGTISVIMDYWTHDFVTSMLERVD